MRAGVASLTPFVWPDRTYICLSCCPRMKWKCHMSSCTSSAAGCLCSIPLQRIQSVEDRMGKGGRCSVCANGERKIARCIIYIHIVQPAEE